ncbi:MAG: bacterioferritin [Myxococcales bacterium]|jgi:bacterioferritin
MKGHPDVIRSLNALLTHELSAVDQYVVQSLMLEDWGYTQLHERIAHEADDERGHVARLVQRILYLEGQPDVSTRAPLKIGENVKEMFEHDLAYEAEVAALLNDAIALCRDKSDNGTRALLEEILNDTERDHILWLQTQLRLIEDLGLAAYVAEKL